ncbi:MAG: ABC transporter ATP-binding protein [Clostridia bacterium]|nr:ABC transporter ATP-binding protein [Clostridia bacterium]
MAVLSCLNVTKYFGENRVLDNVSLEIEKGSFVSIIGASGSGKSTLLTILGGIDKPSEGSVILDGVEISKMSEKELAILRRTKLGFVFQFFNLAPYLTAEENVLLPITLKGKVSEEDKNRARELMEYLGISELKNKLPGKMSGGEQQRVAIARGLIINPEVILLDEPTGNLDSKNSEEIMNLLKRINEEFNTTIVQVTHSDVNANYGNVLITIKDGKIIRQDVAKQDVIREETIEVEELETQEEVIEVAED